jgi:hypothetical protein
MSKDFIFTDYLSDLTICNKLIKKHKQSKSKFDGLIGGRGGELKVNKEHKDSIDIQLGYEDPVALEYVKLLQEINLKYIEKFPFCNDYAAWAITEKMNVQHYKPGASFKAWHSERVGRDGEAAFRHLVFMTYLNDVTDNGETEFYHQKLKIKPKKGLTVIWPSDWTYTHRGIPSKTQEKYIITGWFNFVTV